MLTQQAQICTLLESYIGHSGWDTNSGHKEKEFPLVSPTGWLMVFLEVARCCQVKLVSKKPLHQNLLVIDLVTGRFPWLLVVCMEDANVSALTR